MNGALLPVGLAFLLLTGSAVSGPWLLRRAAPTLARTPRLAVGLLAGGVVGWLLMLLAMGPLAAWLTSGPALFSEPAMDYCQRCATTGNPFSGPSVDTFVPPVLFPAFSVIGVLLISGAVLRHVMRRRAAARAMAIELSVAAATPTRVAGHRVLLVQDARPIAFSLPSRHGGIVVSTETLRILSTEELAAVLAHEYAHVRQHHHLVKTLIEGIARPLRWVPLVRAAASAVPHYLEIAADDDARRHAGTPALASALLKLGEPLPSLPQSEMSPSAAVQPLLRSAMGHEPAGHLLHAAGPDRIPHLVAPAQARTRAGSTVASVLHVGALGSVGTVVHVLYVTAFIVGCT